MGLPAFCSSLAQTLGPKLALIGSSVYNESTSSYFTALGREISPACVAVPTSTQDVVEILKSVKPFVDSGECLLAIKARGNQPFAGAANIAGGVTIDLRSLNNIDIKAEAQRVSVGAGVSWGDLYEKLARAGLAVAGGRSSQGGMGGLALGGKNTHTFYCLSFTNRPPSKVDFHSFRLVKVGSPTASPTSRLCWPTAA